MILLSEDQTGVKYRSSLQDMFYDRRFMLYGLRKTGEGMEFSPSPVTLLIKRIDINMRHKFSIIRKKEDKELKEEKQFGLQLVCKLMGG